MLTQTSPDRHPPPQGTAAYKTVELDDLLDGLPIQHREVMLYESDQFKSLFKAVTYLKGGVDSAFNRVEPGAYASRLLHVKKVGKTTSIIEVPCKRASLNEGDSFVLDTGATIYVWAGSESSPFETLAANIAAENLEQERHGAAKATRDIDDYFWKKLGGEGKIKSKEEAGEIMPVKSEMGEGVLYKLSDSTGMLPAARSRKRSMQGATEEETNKRRTATPQQDSKQTPDIEAHALTNGGQAVRP